MTPEAPDIAVATPGAMSGTRWSKPDFTGSLRTFLPLWLETLGLSLVTLGFYRFWGKTRIRRYLWSHTRFLDEPLEYTGTGKELFIGFLIALVVFVLPASLFSLLIQFGSGNQAQLVGSLTLLFYVYFFVLTNFAMYRAQRYRLTRTLWRGIRGGMATNGWNYAMKGLGLYAAAGFTMGFLMPWASTTLWNDRWNDASFGDQPFRSDAPWRPLFCRFLHSLLAYAGLLILFGLAVFGGLKLIGEGNISLPEQSVAAGVLFVVALYAAGGIVFIAYRALQLRLWISHLRWAGLKFEFTARTLDWALFYGKLLGVVVLTLGLGLFGLAGYFSWRFICQHIDIAGDIDATLLGQSRTAEPGQGEGLADALDVGAF